MYTYIYTPYYFYYYTCTQDFYIFPDTSLTPCARPHASLASLPYIAMLADDANNYRCGGAGWRVTECMFCKPARCGNTYGRACSDYLRSRDVGKQIIETHHIFIYVKAYIFNPFVFSFRPRENTSCVRMCVYGQRMLSRRKKSAAEQIPITIINTSGTAGSALRS